MRLPAKSCNPPLQSGVVPGDWRVTSAALVYKKGLRGQLEGHESVGIVSSPGLPPVLVEG